MRAVFRVERFFVRDRALAVAADNAVLQPVFGVLRRPVSGNFCVPLLISPALMSENTGLATPQPGRTEILGQHGVALRAETIRACLLSPDSGLFSGLAAAFNLFVVGAGLAEFGRDLRDVFDWGHALFTDRLPPFEGIFSFFRVLPEPGPALIGGQRFNESAPLVGMAFVYSAFVHYSASSISSGNPN